MNLNPHISVDCVIFGFDGLRLKLLLIYRKFSDSSNPGFPVTDIKLPGDFIREDEDLDAAAWRILKELTGLDNIYLRQFGVFGNPGRITRKRDIEWLHKTTGLEIRRVVTIAYYSLIKIDESREETVKSNNAAWLSLDSCRNLAFDHSGIVQSALLSLRDRIKYEPVVFELLPKKFTIRQHQNLFEAISGKIPDNRNFRKKILNSGYLVPLDEKQIKVPHKPARMFRFDRKLYDKNKKVSLVFQF